MQTRIQGTTMPVLEVQLDPNEAVFSESGELSWMTQSIQMTTHTQMGGGGGLFGVLKRFAGGGSIFMTEYRAWQYPGEVAFASKVPGHIIPVQVGQGYEYMVHRHGFAGPHHLAERPHPLVFHFQFVMYLVDSQRIGDLRVRGRAYP